MALVATVMAKKASHQENSTPARTEPCTYASVKIDDELPPLVRIAAANKGISVQEYMSNAINTSLKEDLGQGVNRRPAKRGK